MDTYLLFEVKAFLYQKKMIGILALWFSISIGLLGQIIFLDAGNHKEEIYNELNDTRVVLRSVETYYRQTEEEQTLSDNLFAQQSLIASKYNGLIFDTPEWFYSAGTELAQLRLDADDYPEEKIASSLFPPTDFSQRQIVEYKDREIKTLPVRENSENLYDYTLKLLPVYGSLAFLFTLFLSSDIGLRDLNHLSLVKSYPIQRKKRVFIQTAIYGVGGSLCLILLTAISFMIVQLLWGTSDWLWPVGYYIRFEYKTIPLIQYLLLFMSYLFVLMIHTTLFNFLMNQLFKNKYVSLMIGSLLYGLGRIISTGQSWVRFFPFPYYHLDRAFTGFLSEEVHAGIDISRGFFTLFIWGIIFLFIALQLINPATRKENTYVRS